MNKGRKKYEIIIFNVYLFLLIFNMINREFVPIIDMRYLIIPLAVFLVVNRIVKGRIKLEKFDKKTLILFIIFYIFMNISNIMPLFNGIEIRKSEFINLMILHAFNFLNIVTMYLNSDLINKKNLLGYFKICILFLSISILVVALGIKLPFTDYKGVICGISHYNMFGYNCRYSGYLIDPNYVTLIGIIFFAMILKFENGIVQKIFYSILALLLIALSFSKTVILMLIPVLVCVFILNKIHNEKAYKIFLITVIVGIFSIPLLLYGLNIFGNTVTMKLRYYMWEIALDLFSDSPIIGNGISTFRSVSYVIGNWYVQCHSTIMQLMAEQGILSVIIYGIILYNIISQKNTLLTFTLLIYIAWGINYETLYLNFTILFFSILPLVTLKKEKKKFKKAYVFIINSVQNGGAERVVVNQANKLIEMGKNVIFILFRNRFEYEISPKIKVIKLTEKEKFSKFEKIFMFPILIKKLNYAIDEIKEKYDIKMLTSHLPLPHIICRFSNIRKEVIYVVHNPHYQFKYSQTLIFKLLMKFMYNKKKIVTVSDGVKNEMLKDYNIKTKTIKTIYNPINLLEIDSKLLMDNTVDVKDDYILFCGRLSKQKRPDRIIEAFYNGKFYKKYKLVLIGIGELEPKIRKLIKDNKMEKYILLKGWQENAYQWMQQSKLLVCTSDYESFGMILVEALASSAKVVSVNCKFGPDEILVGNLKKYLCSMEVKDIISKMNMALKSYPKNLRSYVTKFDVENNINEYIETSKKWSD